MFSLVYHIITAILHNTAVLDPFYPYMAVLPAVARFYFLSQIRNRRKKQSPKSLFKIKNRPILHLKHPNRAKPNEA